MNFDIGVQYQLNFMIKLSWMYCVKSGLELSYCMNHSGSWSMPLKGIVFTVIAPVSYSSDMEAEQIDYSNSCFGTKHWMNHNL